MSVRANIAPGYRWRLGAIALMCLCWAAWSAYDGFVVYPNENKVVEAFEQNKTTNPLDWQEKWVAMARENGWPEGDPGTKHSNGDIYMQYGMLAMTLPVGLLFGLFFLKTFSRWIACDDNAVTNNEGDSAPFSEITNLNKDRWPTKGIAVVTYNDQGLSRKLILDDWKFDRDAVKEILLVIEARIGTDKITGAPEQTVAAAPEEPSVEQPPTQA